MESQITDKSALIWVLLALAIAIAGTAGSLWLSWGMGLKACPLCLYQRAFLMSAAAVLLLGLTTPLRSSSVLLLLALPAIVGGLGVAGFHEFLEQTSKLECPMGVFGVGTAPQQSLSTFVVLLVVLLTGSVAGESAGIARTAAAVVLGLLLAGGTVKTAPPMPAAPPTPYEQPPDVCRPPYRTAESAQTGVP